MQREQTTGGEEMPTAQELTDAFVNGNDTDTYPFDGEEYDVNLVKYAFKWLIHKEDYRVTRTQSGDGGGIYPPDWYDDCMKACNRAARYKGSDSEWDGSWADVIRMTLATVELKLRDHTRPRVEAIEGFLSEVAEEIQAVLGASLWEDYGAAEEWATKLLTKIRAYAAIKRGDG